MDQEPNPTESSKNLQGTLRTFIRKNQIGGKERTQKPTETRTQPFSLKLLLAAVL